MPHLAALLLCVVLASGCGSRHATTQHPVQPDPPPPALMLPGTGILSHEYQEQEALPRVVRLSSLSRSRASGDTRTEQASVSAAPAGAAGQAAAAAAVPQRGEQASSASRRRIPDDIAAPAPEEWRQLACEAQEIFGLDAGLVLAVIRAESSFDHTAVSPAGAEGAMQIMPRTQEDLGLIDPFDPRANVYAGSQYLMKQLQRFGSIELALAAYNAGPQSVEYYGGIPPFPETREFVRRVLAYWAQETGPGAVRSS